MGFLSSIGSMFFGSAYDAANSSTKRPDRAFNRSRPADEDRNVGAWGLDKLRLESNDAYRNNPVVRALIDRACDFVVGEHGIQPQAKTLDSIWNKQAERYYTEWAKIADARGRLDGLQMQRMDVISLYTSGGNGIIFNSNGQIQPIEAERIATPDDLVSDSRILNGVKLSDTGRPLSYYVLARGENGNRDGRAFVQVEAADFDLLSDPFRPDQVRGIPWLAPVLNLVKDYEDLNKSVLSKARLEARQGLLVTTAMGEERAKTLGPRKTSTATADPKQERVFERQDDLSVYNFLPGESVSSIGSITPNPQLVDYCRHLVRHIAAALGFPYEFLMLDFMGGSFAQSRAALIMGYRRMQSIHAILERRQQRVWNWRIAKAIKEGHLAPAPVDPDTGFSQWYKVEWSRPRHDWIDPVAQVNAEKSALALGTESHSSIAKKYGRDSEDILEEKAIDIANAKRIAASHGIEDWRDLMDWTNNPQRQVVESKKESPDET